MTILFCITNNTKLGYFGVTSSSDLVLKEMMILSCLALGEFEKSCFIPFDARERQGGRYFANPSEAEDMD